MSLNQTLTFSAIKVHDDRKEVKKDDAGYYYMTLGALNCFNSAGAYYVEDGVKDLLENQSNLFSRRLHQGYLYGEMGHPNFTPGMSNNDYLVRNLRIEQSNISHHIKSVDLVPTNESSGLPGGGPIIKVMGWIKPSGEKGQFLKEVLDNPDANVAFSIRSLTADTPVKGVMIKKIMQIITWDWVVEPGIKDANKWSTLGMESLDLARYTIKDIENIYNKQIKVGIGKEDTDNLKSIIKELKHTRLVSETNKIFNNW